MNKRHYEHTLPNIRGSLSNTYIHHGMYLLYFLKVTTEIPPVRTVRVYTILL